MKKKQSLFCVFFLGLILFAWSEQSSDLLSYTQDTAGLNSSLIEQNEGIQEKNTGLQAYIKNYPLETSFVFFLLIGLITISSVLFVLAKVHKNKNLALEQADKAKTDFLARMSHEIRTPLHAIIGLNALARDKIEQNAEIDVAALYLKKIDISAHHLLDLVNNILDYSKISEGQMKIKKSTFSLNSLFSSLYDLYFIEARNKNITFSIQNTIKSTDSFIGDALLLREVLSNLLSNAIKFNKPQGVVTLSTELIDPDEQKDHKKILIRFTVSDTGVGMHRKMIEKIFVPFERDEVWDVRQVRGTGLGLPLAKNIVSLLEGNLNVKSTPGIGSTFWFDIPLHLSIEKITQKKGLDYTLNLEQKNVLIAEDDEISAEIIEQILMSFSANSIDKTKNGKECVKAFEKSAVGHYDFIIMDIRMPVMDGYAATKIIRQLNRPDAKQVKIIALSANAFQEDKEESASVGIDYHCAKPLNNEEFVEALLAP